MGFFRLKSNIYNSDQMGQALVEYLLLLVFLVVISSKIVGTFTDFMSDSFGNLGHAMTVNLTVGVCAEECFFAGYKNGNER